MTAKQKIIPNLWFDSGAEEAANFYASTFKDSGVGHITHYTKAGFDVHGMPEGTVMTVEFEIEGMRFVGLNGGPLFKFNPSVSFLVICDTKSEVDRLWANLSEDGAALMELGEYPFSQRYGWTQDKYGLSWQVMFKDGRIIKQKIIPTLMFVGERCGKAEEAINFYASVFHNAKVGDIIEVSQCYGDGGF